MPPHLIDIDDLSEAETQDILLHADRMRRGDAPPRRAGHVLGLAFEDESVRTRIGFAAAMARMEGTALAFPTPYRRASMSGHETMADVVRAVGSYAHVIIARTPTDAAMAEIAAHSPAPVVNAGSGSSAHPTQALIDVFAIMSRFGKVDGLRVGIAGDLAGSRSARSLLRLLARYEPAEVRLMHADGEGALASAMGAEEMPAWSDVGPTLQLDGLDVLYMAGFPAGGGAGGEDPVRKEHRLALRLDCAAARRLPESAMILCPLPRIDEIDQALDADPRTGMFVQSQQGLYVRMAIIDHMLCKAERATT